MPDQLLRQFTYGEHAVRTVSRDGDPWFVASDVITVLDLHRTAVRRLDPDEKGVHSTHTLGGDQDVTVINEAGLYTLILGSRKQEAKMFKRWVTHEVIPSIRKTGAYAVPKTREEQLSDAVLIAQELIVEKQQAIEQLTPRAQFADKFLSANGDYDTRDAAQILKRDHGIVDMGQNRLRDWMQAHGWLDKRRRPTYKAVEPGYLRLKPSSFRFRRSGGEEQLADPQVRVTPRGVEALARALSKELVA